MDNDWQPIETAPRDGTPLLLYVPGCNSWNRKRGMPDIMTGIWDDGYSQMDAGWYGDLGDIDHGYESTGACFEHIRLSPTHWMPLPKPPEPSTCA